jgi:uncharacterized protein involved in exopolysaccharide biosynthesis
VINGEGVLSIISAMISSLSALSTDAGGARPGKVVVLPGKKYSPEEIVRILLRRKWLILLPFAVGVAAAPPVASRVLERYRSETLIMVIPQRVPTRDVKSTVTAKVDDRLSSSIADPILTRSRLERIIRDLDLYSKERARGVLEDVVQRMRGDIEIKLEGKESFRVSYVSRDPRVAQMVTARLASLFIEENMRDSQNPAESPNSVPETQLERRQVNEHFRILKAASLPEKPYNPVQSIGFVLAGAAGGLVLGLALVVLLEYRVSSFSCEEDVLRVLSLPVLGVVPIMRSERERKSQRYRRLAVELAGLAVLLGAGVVLVLWRLRL